MNARSAKENECLPDLLQMFLLVNQLGFSGGGADLVSFTTT